MWIARNKAISFVGERYSTNEIENNVRILALESLKSRAYKLGPSKYLEAQEKNVASRVYWKSLEAYFLDH